MRYWYLGNEIDGQARYPAYPAQTKSQRAPSVTEYKQMLRNVVQPMLNASPALPLRLLTVSGSTSWNKAWAEAVGEHIYATSFHAGYMNQPRSFTQEAVTACAKRPQNDFVGLLKNLRQALNATGKDIAISADEWGLGPPWKVNVFSVAHGMYAAGFLGAVTRAAPEVNLQFTNYFEPVNEGAIQAHPFNSTLTPVGQVMALYAQHQGGARVDLPPGSFGGDLDTTASLSAGGDLLVTVANLNAVGWTSYNVDLTLRGWRGGAAAALTVLRASGFDAAATFDSARASAAVSASGVLSLSVPPFSVVHARVAASRR